MTPSLLPVLLEATLRALVAALAVWAGLRLLRVGNLLAQKAAWGLVLIAAVAMPLLMRWQWLPAWTAVKVPTASWARTIDGPPPSASASAAPTSSFGEPEEVPQPVSARANRSPVPVTPTDELHAQPSTELEIVPIPAPAAARARSKPTAMGVAGRLLAIGWILYLGVCATLLLRLLWGLASSLRLWIESEPLETPARVDLSGSIRVRSSLRIAAPVNIGSGILLPANYAEWDEDKLRVVLAHERSHIRQRDFYLQLLAGLYAAVTWFSPLGWWLKHKLTELGEAISDRAGLDAAASPSAYAGLLLEFAALPRSTLTGVAMAHSKNLSHRIERLLNDSSFRLAFSGGRRALLTVLVPALLIAATAMIRVQAAANPRQSDSTQTTATGKSAATGQSNPQPAQVSDAGSAETPQAAAPAPEPAPAPPIPLGPASAGQNPAPGPPPPPTIPAGNPQESGPQESGPAIPAIPPIPPIPPVDIDIDFPSCWGSGDSYAIVGGPETKTRFCGDWGDEGAADVEKARGETRNQAHGHFLLFRHAGKLYVIDDPAIVSQIEALDKLRSARHEEMQALLKQMRDAGQQARNTGEQARDEARKEREAAANIPAPDLSREMAELNATVASLTAKQGSTVSREELAQLQREISAIQRRVIDAELKVEVNFDWSKFNAEMGKFREEMSKFNEEMGRLGAQMGGTVQENHEKIGAIIDQSLTDGKARPVK